MGAKPSSPAPAPAPARAPEPLKVSSTFNWSTGSFIVSKSQAEIDAETLGASIGSNEEFKKPVSPDLKLTIGTTPACGICTISVQNGISSSSVTLTRNILGKIDIPKKKYPPSNLPEDAQYGGDWHDHGNNKHEDYATAFDGKRYSEGKNGSMLYSPPYPGSDFPEVLSKADTEQMPGKIEYAKKYAAQSFVENANRKKIDAENKLEKTRVRIWNPSETKGYDGSIAINYLHHGALTKLFIVPSIPFSITYNSPSTGSRTSSVSRMSVFHPFPLRVDNFCEKGRQYDACFQIGDFPSSLVPGSSIIVLIPLKVAENDEKLDEGGKFINAVANKFSSIIGQQPDKMNGYPETTANTGANWMLEKILKTERPFYSWTYKEGFQLIVMAEPIIIVAGDMESIKRLPATPPQDTIHYMNGITYKPAPPIDCSSKQVTGCQPSPFSKVLSSIGQPNVNVKTSKVEPGLIFSIIFGTLGTVVVILGVWLGIKFAMGPGKTFMKSIGDSLGKSLAGGYDALKKVNLPTVPKMPAIPQSIKTTRRNLGKRLGLGTTGNFGTKRQPQKDPSLTDVFPDIKSTRDLTMTTNPLFNKDKTLRNSKRGSISDIANLPAANIPEPKPGTIKSITNLPAANIPKPVKEPRLKRDQGQRTLPIVNSAMQELNDLEDTLNKEKRQTKDNLLRKASVVNAFSSRNKTSRNRLADISKQQSIKKAAQSNRDLGPRTIERQQSARKVDQPIQDPGAGTGLLPQTAPIVTPRRRRRIIQEEEDDDEEEVKKDSRDDEYDPTKLFGSKFLRKSHGFNYGGKRRQKRKKTGRKI
jgi:hypothetical protein